MSGNLRFKNSFLIFKFEDGYKFANKKETINFISLGDIFIKNLLKKNEKIFLLLYENIEHPKGGLMGYCHGDVIDLMKKYKTFSYTERLDKDLINKFDGAILSLLIDSATLSDVQQLENKYFKNKMVYTQVISIKWNENSKPKIKFRAILMK